MNAQPPSTHFGRYRVVGELGRGAMGVVYEAEDETLQRQVAVKTMLLSDDAEERAGHEARFRQEAKAAAGLNHPNVITIYDMGREGDWLYIAMEMLRGQELRALMNGGAIPLPVVVDLLSQVASGLGAAHMRGIVHRDIKPSNIMVMGGRHAKIMDFGVARMQVSEVKTQAGVMLGSPKYMAPEQVEGRGVDSRSDIFSLGAVLYECVAGTPPFKGADLGTLLFDIVHGAPVPPSQVNPQVPADLDRIVARTLRKDPAERYQDADLLAHELAQCAAHLTAGAVRPGTFSPAATISRRIAFPEATLQPVHSPAAAPEQAQERTLVEATSPAAAYETTRAPDACEATGAADACEATGARDAYEATQVSVMPAPVAAPAPQEKPAPGDKPRRASFPVAPEFDSIAALHRLATGAASAEPPPVALPVESLTAPPRWAWPAAYAAAALVAVLIAFA